MSHAIERHKKKNVDKSNPEIDSAVPAAQAPTLVPTSAAMSRPSWVRQSPMVAS